MKEDLITRKLSSMVSGPAALLRSVWAPLRKILTFSLADPSIAPARNVTVSIEKETLSVAYASRILSKIRIRGFKTYPLDEKFTAPESFASSVDLAINALGAPRTNITLGIPKAWTIIKVVEFPSTVKDNIPDVVSYEMDRLTPFSVGEVLYDYRILRENAERITVLLVVVKSNMITPYIEALAEKGFSVTRVALNLSGAGTLFCYTDECTDSIFLKVNEKEYEGAVFSGCSMTGAFSGGFRTEDERGKVDVLAAEIASITDKMKEDGKSPHIFMSLKCKSTSLGEMMKLKMNVPFRILGETDLPFGLRARAIPIEAAGGLIESLWPHADGLNLLVKGRPEEEKTPFVLSVVLAIALIAVWSLYLLVPVKIEGARLQEIERQIAARKDEVRKVEALKKEMETLGSEISSINDFKEGRPMTLTIVRELTTILPKSAWLTRARITETTVEIEGYASSATELLPKLEASKYLKKVEFASPTFRDARMNADRFNIKMEIQGVKKREAEQPKEKEKPKEGAKPKNEKK